MRALIGRERSLADASALLQRDDVRLLTISGPGGVGKTRLALEIAATAGDQFADGVVVVPLQALHDPTLVLGALARAVGLFDADGDLEARLVAHLEGRQLLLVVDNFEQVAVAAPALGALVAAAPGVKALVTSRSRLRIQGEQELSLGPLARDDAVHVFLERARAVRPDFEPADAELAACAAICDQLDCLPLAIELAATRIKLLSPAGILARLERPLELLTAGARDAPARHRSLRDTIGWSYALLGDREQALFRRLAVFIGGFTMDAAEAVCGGDLDTLATLVDESLVWSDGERFSQLETIREYAAEALEESGEEAAVRRAHARYFAAEVLPAAGSPGQAGALRHAATEADHGNLRAAIRWALDNGEIAKALELCARLSGFWLERGYLGEGRAWLDEALAAPSRPTSARARALTASGVLAHYQSDYDRADRLCAEALTLSRSLGDERGVAEALTGLALVRRTRGDYAGAEPLFAEALALYETFAAEEAVARALYRSAMSLCLGAQHERARPLFQRSLDLSRRLGDSTGVALGLQGLVLARRPGSEPEARAQVGESLELLRALGDRRNVAKVLVVAAEVNGALGDGELAAEQFAEALTLFVEFGDRWLYGWSVETAAELVARAGDHERAARLLGAAETVRLAIRAPLPAALRERHDSVLGAVRSGLGEGRLGAVLEEGRGLAVGATVELVQPPSRSTGAGGAGVGSQDGLTDRETEVLALVAEGLTDAEVAERLVVSIRTVHAHLRSIYRKLDVRTRSAATRYALQQGL